MIPKVKPAMAYPDFGAATMNFAPDRWPEIEKSPISVERFEAVGRTASGVMVRQESTLVERKIVVSYKTLTESEKEILLGAGGFFETVGGKNFEFKSGDGTIYTVKFAMERFTAWQEDFDKWRVSSIEMVVV